MVEELQSQLNENQADSAPAENGGSHADTNWTAWDSNWRGPEVERPWRNRSGMVAAGDGRSRGGHNRPRRSIGLEWWLGRRWPWQQRGTIGPGMVVFGQDQEV